MNGSLGSLGDFFLDLVGMLLFVFGHGSDYVFLGTGLTDRRQAGRQQLHVC